MDKLAHEIPAHVRPALGRIDLAREPDFALGPLSVSPSRLEVAGGGVRRALQRRVMQVLVALARSPEKVVSQHELISRCWGGLSVSDDAIGRCIAQLRQLAQAWPEPPFAIETIPGVGYRLDAAKVELAMPLAPSGARVRRPFLAIAAAATLVAIGVGAWLALGRAPAPAVGVEVAPFQVMADDAETRALSARMSDELLNVFSANQIAQTARSGAASGGSGAGFLVTGAVRRSPADTRVSVRLEDARTHAGVWSEEFVRPAGADADLETEVATKVADIVQMAQFAYASRPPLDDDTALAALLAAHDRIRWDRPTSWARLLELARQPSIVRPDFAFGHSMLATADAHAVFWNALPERRSELIADGRREARRALELDPRDSAAWYSLSMLLEPMGQFRQREAILLEGIARDGHPAPPYAALFEAEGETLRDVGRPKAAVAFFERAQAIDPLSPPKNNSLMLAYAETGDEVHAQELLAQSLRRWPNHPDLRLYRLIVNGFYGSPAAAIALLDDPAARPVELPGPAIAAWRAFLRARMAPAETAQAVKLIVDADDHTPLGHEIAIAMLAFLGHGDLAWVQADKAARQGRLDPGVLFAAKVRAVRQDPRFPSLVVRMGVVDYWRETGRWPEVCQGPQPEPECPALKAAAQPTKA